MKVWDAVVIGGGHNGLVAANYLQKAGKKTLILENRAVVGGACVTEEPVSGFKMSTTSYVCSLLRPEIIHDFELEKFGFELLTRDPSSFSPYPENRHLFFWKDQNKTCQEIAKFSRRDAARFPDFEKKLDTLAHVVRPLLMKSPFDPTRISWENIRASMSLLPQMRSLRRTLYDQLRLFSMSVVDYLEPWFESEELKVRLATDGVIGAWASPYTPQTAYILFHHVMGESNGQTGVWGYVKGGMGTITQALLHAFEAQGGSVRTQTKVAKIIIENNKAVGVETAGGDRVYARCVLSNCDPKTTFLNLVGKEQLPSDFSQEIDAIKMRSGVVKINLALKGLPEFTSYPTQGQVGPPHRGTIHIAPSLEYMHNAFLDVERGFPSARPVIEMTIPSAVDPTLAPAGHHVASLFVQYAPHTRQDGKAWTSETRSAFAQSVFREIEEYAPGFADLITYSQVLTPVDLEREFGLRGGNIFHGEMTLDQLFFMRPCPHYANYATPISNLYLCGSGTHPGGGVMGSPGYLAAKTVLRHSRRWWH